MTDLGGAVMSPGSLIGIPRLPGLKTCGLSFLAPSGTTFYSTGCQPGDDKVWHDRRRFRAPEELPETGVAAGHRLASADFLWGFIGASINRSGRWPPIIVCDAFRLMSAIDAFGIGLVKHIRHQGEK